MHKVGVCFMTYSVAILFSFFIGKGKGVIVGVVFVQLFLKDHSLF